MKQHQKWLNETLSAEVAEKFEAETQDVVTIDEIINTISETSWRGALEWTLKEITLSPLGLQTIIDELGVDPRNETKKD